MLTLEEYDPFLALCTLVSRGYQPLVPTHYRKRLVKLLGLKRPIVEALT